MGAVKVLVVDDSMLFREVVNLGLKSKLPEGSRIEKAMDSFEARDKILSFDPDVMILDVEMPHMNGIEFLRRLIVQYNLPTIVSSSRGIYRDLAMDAGAFSFLEKPSSTFNTKKYLNDLCAEIMRAYEYGKGAAQQAAAQPTPVQPVQPQPRPPQLGSVYVRRSDEQQRLRRVETLLSQADEEPERDRVQYEAVELGKRPAPVVRPVEDAETMGRRMKSPVPTVKVELIAIGASTGGTEALSKILKDLASPLPPIVIVQHIPPMFSKLFAERLDGECPLSIKEAEDGDKVEANHVYIAPGDKQMKVKRFADLMQLDVNYGEKVNGHCPSVDVLFDSVADRIGRKAMGVMLTGMGNDGAKGMLKMREAGSVTLGQDQASCIVYGMPKAAYEIGAVVQQLPLSEMASMITLVARHPGRC